MYAQEYINMNYILLVGYLGTLGLIFAWVLAAYKDAKKHKIVIDIDFSLIYIFGNCLLLIYALLVNDIVFIVLELFLVIAISIETIYAYRAGKTRRRRKQ